MKKTLQTIYLRLCTVTVFADVMEKSLFKRFFAYMRADKTDCAERRRAYALFAKEIYEGGGNLTTLVETLVSENENVYVKGVALQKTLNANVVEAAKKELETFSYFAAITPKDFAADMEISVEELPQFDSEEKSLSAAYAKRLQEIGKYGYGIFSAHRMFRLSDSGEIEPIVSADKTTMEQFIGYEEERGKVVANTQAFIAGRPAANVLLCGDAGAGKSSTVKAVANAFFSEGIRLIELRKDQLRYLPYVMGKVSGNPLKFIIFIDDLAFNKSDDNFSMLKAALEGSASAKAKNAVIYATSNRRHIIKESFGDREGDDVHRNDTLQESLSLSERFGLVVLFSKPNKKLYLEIVHKLAARYGITMEEKELEIKAEAFALKRGNRSARCAEQFVQSLL